MSPEEFAAKEVDKLTNGYTDENGNFITGFQYWCSTYCIIEGQTQQQTAKTMNRDINKPIFEQFK